jgi:hypothetical protein
LFSGSFFAVAQTGSLGNTALDTGNDASGTASSSTVNGTNNQSTATSTDMETTASSTPDTTASTTESISEPATATTTETITPPEKLNIAFLAAPDSVSGSTDIYARTNVKADSVKFFLKGTAKVFIGDLKIGSSDYYNNYHFFWDTADYKDGIYEFYAVAAKDDQSASTATIKIVLNRSIKPVNLASASSTEQTTELTLDKTTATSTATTSDAEITRQSFKIKISTPSVGQTLSGLAKIVADTEGPIRRVEFSYYEHDKKFVLGKVYYPEANDYQWTYAWQTGEIKNGDYTLEVSAWDDKEKSITSGRTNIRIDNKPKAETPAAADAEATGTEPTDGRVIVPTKVDTTVRDYADLCRANDIGTKADCLRFLADKFGQEKFCARASAALCKKIFNDVVLSTFIDTNILTPAKAELAGLVGKNIEIKKDPSDPSTPFIITSFSADGRATGTEISMPNAMMLLPFGKDTARLGLLILSSATTDPTVGSTDSILMFDADGDGLTDEMEKRLGTDPKKFDTDSDGFGDGAEAASGHNPLGSGDLKKPLEGVEKSIVNKMVFEQPTSAVNTPDEALKIKVVNGARQTANSNNKLKFEGQGPPDRIISIYIYSGLPIVVTVRTDKNGNWLYELDKTLIDGKHEAYVVINDEQGKITTQSSPLSFFIKEARAVSQTDFIGADTSVPDRTREMTIWYAAGGIGLILVGIGLFFIFGKTKDKTVS